ncbi:hypothetical protein ZIOFF_010389 [Zingiber officinale]|uniref:Uncharacterized protein n=1 Tax=Zingiber officinale TaxID=94328 RepID=A0A8J5HJ43_ZINOF|nr:hypothetical protein ZIOFF_010389 [Zingiber officinale]
MARSGARCPTVGVQGIDWVFEQMIFALVYCTTGISGNVYSQIPTCFYICNDLQAVPHKGYQKRVYDDKGCDEPNIIVSGFSKGNSLGTEIIETFILIYTIFSATDTKKSARDSHRRWHRWFTEEGDGATGSLYGGGGTPTKGAVAQGAWCRWFAEEGAAIQGGRCRQFMEDALAVRRGGDTPAISAEEEA